MKENPYAPKVPCHRVVDSNGMLRGFKGSVRNKELDEKAELLRGEGIVIKNNKVLNLDKVLYKFK